MAQRLDKDFQDRLLDMDKESLDWFQEQAEIKKKELDDYMDKLIKHEFADENLQRLNKPLKRKQVKALKKEGIDLNSFIFNDIVSDDLVDKFLKALNIDESISDEFEDGELKLLIETVFLRTLDPMRYEGNA